MRQVLIAGVHLKNGRTVEADLVVDASGKHSDISRWLEKLGHTTPDTISVASGLRYTYRMYEMTDDPDREWTIAVCMDHPEYNRTAVVIPIETNKWIVGPLHSSSDLRPKSIATATMMPAQACHDVALVSAVLPSSAAGLISNDLAKKRLYSLMRSVPSVHCMIVTPSC